MPPKKKEKPSSNSDNGGGIRISARALATIGGLIPILGLFYVMATRIATRADIDSLKSSISPTLTQHEDRIRALELQNAAHFGASPTTAHTDLPSWPQRIFSFALAQYASAPAAPKIPATGVQRRVVVPQQMIDAYHLEPSTGFAYALLGEDGKFYSLDDVLAIVIDSIKVHLEPEPQRKK